MTRTRDEAMESIRRQNLKHAILSHIAKTILGELRDWEALEAWLDFEFESEAEKDMAADMFILEAKRLFKRIG